MAIDTVALRASAEATIQASLAIAWPEATPSYLTRMSTAIADAAVASAAAANTGLANGVTGRVQLSDGLGGFTSVAGIVWNSGATRLDITGAIQATAGITAGGSLSADTGATLGNATTGVSGLLRLHSTAANPVIYNAYGDGSTLNEHIFRRSRNTMLSLTSIQSGDLIGDHLYQGYISTLPGYLSAAAMGAYVDGVPSSTSMPGRLVFFTTPALATALVERMRINQDGSIFMGTYSGATVPVGVDLWHVSNGSNDIMFERCSASAASGKQLVFRRATNTPAAPQILTNGDGIGQLDFLGHDGTAFVASSMIRAAVDGVPGVSDMPGRIEFHTSLAGTIALVERMRIDNAGLIQTLHTSPVQAPVQVRISGTNAFTSGIDFHTATTALRGFVGWRGVSSTAPAIGGVYLWNYDNTPLILGNNNTTRIYIDLNGETRFGGIAAAAVTCNSGLLINGTASSVTAGPNIHFTNSAVDNRPLMQILPYAHNDVEIAFDCYYNGANQVSSSASGSFMFVKSTNIFRLMHGIAAAGGTFAPANNTVWTANGGMQVGAPTGGDKGAGTINAGAVYDDNVLLTCYVPEFVRSGGIDLTKWDKTIPGEVFKHSPARRFLANAQEELDPKKYAEKWLKTGHLPALPSPEEWAKGDNKLSMGRLVQGLWETVEVLAEHVRQLTNRLDAVQA